jgi:hypothetical protein
MQHPCLDQWCSFRITKGTWQSIVLYMIFWHNVAKYKGKLRSHLVKKESLLLGIEEIKQDSQVTCDTNIHGHASG